MKILFLIFLIVPLIEIYLLIQIGSQIGAALTIFLVVFTAMLGAFLVRAQGFSTFARVQTQMAKGELPAVEMVEGLCLFLAGALLLTPGFFTDAVGFALLTPPLRRAMIKKAMAKRMSQGAAGYHHSQDFRSSSGGRIIDVEYKED